MTPQTWQDELSVWVSKRRALRDVDADSVVSFFASAFEHTQIDNRAWFGVHGQTASLVVGHLFLAALVVSGNDHGLWILLDPDAPTFDGFDIKPVKSTVRSAKQLLWAHSTQVSTVATVDRYHPIWTVYAGGSTGVLVASMASESWDETNERRKCRLSDIKHRNALVSLRDIDMMSIMMSTVEGRSKLTTHLRRERDPRIIKMKKQAATTLACEACGFLFSDFYGDEYCEVHHKEPLGGTDSPVVTTLDTLAILCANCHRVAHLHTPPLTVMQIQDRIAQQKRRVTFDVRPDRNRGS